VVRGVLHSLLLPNLRCHTGSPRDQGVDQGGQAGDNESRPWPGSDEWFVVWTRKQQYARIVALLMHERNSANREMKATT
jgi:hypothetical protein